MKLLRENFKSSGLQQIVQFLILILVSATIHSGEGDQQRVLYETLRQELITTFEGVLTTLTTLRNQYSTDQEFDRALITDVLNQLFVGLTPQMRNAVHLVFVTTDSPSARRYRAQHLLKYLKSHPYHESNGDYLMQILERYITLGNDTFQIQENLQQSIHSVPPQQTLGVTLMYMIQLNRIREQMEKLLRDMAIID